MFRELEHLANEEMHLFSLEKERQNGGEPSSSLLLPKQESQEDGARLSPCGTQWKDRNQQEIFWDMKNENG